MALKFRRGTTAQKSGSLAFGEPYVNTTLGTLQIGGDTGDITLAGTSANVGISGSSLDITGNAKIDGNLTLGGNITIGDQTSDTVAVNANLSSSLIPSTTNAFDLGSASRIWRDLYLSTASIKFVDGTGNVISTITNANIVTTDKITSGSISLVASLPSGTVSGSAQVVGILSSLNTNSSSVNGHISDINTKTGSFETKFSTLQTLTASVNAQVSRLQESTASLNAYTSSNDTTNTAQNSRLTNLETTSASINTSITSINGHIADINTKTGSFETKFSTLQTLTASVQFQIDRIQESTASLNSFTSSINTTIKSKLDTDGVISGSSQVTLSATTGFTSYSTSVDSRIVEINTYTSSLRQALTASGANVLFSGDVSIPGNLTVSGTTTAINSSTIQLGDNIIELNGTSVTNGGIQVKDPTGPNNATGSLLWNTTNDYWVAGVKGSEIKILLEGGDNVVSSSTQVIEILGSLNTYTASNDTLNSLQTTRIDQLAASTASVNSFTSSINTTIKEKLNVEAVVSSSAQVVGILSSLNAYTGSNDTTNTAQNNRLTNLETTSASVNGHIVDINTKTGSFETKFSTLQTYTASINGHISDINTKTGSFETKFSTLQTYTASVDGHIVDINAYTSSNNTTNTTQNTRLSRLEESTSSLNSFTSSVNGHINDINTKTGSFESKFTTLESYTSSLDAKHTTIQSVTASLLSSQTNLNSYTSSLKTAIELTGSTVSFLGNIVVYGTQSVINSQNVEISDNILYLAPTASVDNDLGIVGHYNDGTYRHAGIFMDASDGHSWKVFNGLTTETSAQIDTNGTGFTLADFKAGAFTGTSFTGQILATNGVVSGSSQVSYVALSNIPSGIVSSSAQIDALFNLDGVFSGSSQVDATATTNWSTGIKTQLNTNTVVSGSSQITLSSTTGYGTVINQNLLTTSDVRHNSLGIGMAASATAGRIDASGDIVAYSTSDRNFKENITPIPNALEKISKISGNTYDWKEDMKEYHGFEGNDVGVIAQEIESVLPQLVTTRETGYKAVKYDKLVALLIEGIKEQQTQIHNLTLEVENLKKQKGL